MRSSRTLSKLAFAVGCACAVGSVSAQTPPAQPAVGTPDGPGSVRVGPLTVTPGIDAALGHDDNLLSRSNRTQSWFTTVAPYVRFGAASGPNTFGLLINTVIGRYEQSSADNYEDYTIAGNADLEFTGRTGLRLRAEHLYGHDPRGSTDRPIGTRPDEFTNTGAEGVFRYGAPGAQGRIEVDAGYFDRTYKNNRAFTAASDRVTKSLGATFFWRVAPKTELLLQGQRRSIDYDLSTSTLDSTEDRLLVGARWEATALTTLTGRVGQLRKNFRDSTRQDSTSGSWDVGVHWAPRTYSIVDLTTSKQPTEATGTGDFISTRLHALSWNHTWSAFISTRVSLSRKEDDFEGTTAGGRRDRTNAFGVGAQYQMRRWLRFGAEYTYTDRSSNVAPLSFRRNLILFTVGATL